MVFICDLCGWSAPDIPWTEEYDPMETIIDHYAFNHQTYTEPTLMPVKNIHVNTEELLHIGREESRRIQQTTPLTDDSIEIIKNARMTKSPFLSVMEVNYNKNYIPKMLAHLKPANYKD